MQEANLTIKPPNFGNAMFEIVGTAPLVIRRFSTKTKDEMAGKIEAGSRPTGKKKHEARKLSDIYNEARYISADGWDGFNASAIRCAMVDACRIVGFKMTLAKLSLFVKEDGWDKAEPQIPLIRIYGKPVMQKDLARVDTGQPYITVRPAYHNWTAKIQLKWDADQFTVMDVTNLLMRVGQQVGIGEGRPYSKNSAGMGWGTFDLKRKEK